MSRGGDRSRRAARFGQAPGRAGVTLSCLALAWCMGAPTLQAQGVDREARQQFDAGVALLHDGRFAEALVRFERARTLREVPAVMVNLALAQRGVGRYVEAERSLARYVELAQGRLDRTRQAEVTRLRAEIQAALAHLTIRVDGEGAAVSLDGRALTAAQRAEAIAVDPGVHVVEVSGEAIETERAQGTLARGQRLTLSLHARPRDVRARLTIEAPADAAVTVDRRPLGRGPQVVLTSPDAHEVEVRREGYETFRASVTSLARQDERVVVVMRRPVDTAPGSIVTRWWFWTGVGALAAGTTAVVLYATRPTEPAETGSLRYAVGAQVVW